MNEQQLKNRFPFTNETDANKKKASEARASLFVNMLKKTIEVEDKALSLPEHLGEDINEKIAVTKDLLRAYFKAVGIEKDVDFLPVHLMPRTEENEGRFGGQSDFHVEIVNYDIEHQAINQLVFLKHLCHELYHSASPVKRVMEFDDSGAFVSSQIDKHGMTYHGRKVANDESYDWRGSAFEEGMAVKLENKMFEEIKKTFPKKDVDYYNQLEADAVELTKANDQSEDIRPELISIMSLKKDGSGSFTYGDDYHHCLNLVEYLDGKIEDFDSLVESSRVNGHPLKLARAIEKKFGKGSFREIVETPSSRSAAISLLEWLKARETS